MTSSPAGPRLSAPVTQSNRAPCHGHSMVPSDKTSPADSGMPWCVHSSRRALTWSPRRIRQTRSPGASSIPRVPPSGISEIETRVQGPEVRERKAQSAKRKAERPVMSRSPLVARRSSLIAHLSSLIASFSACQAMVAHFTRVGNRATPANARSEPNDLSGGSFDRPITRS